jgi:hypothetical protein
MSNVTPIRPSGDGTQSPLPSRELIDKRLEPERERIFRAQNIVNMAAQLLDLRDDEEYHDLWGSLQVASEMLDDAAGNLESMVLLKPEDVS